MPDILFIKTSSLGDVVHNMPAVTDARRMFPDARIGWVVEEAFAPLVKLHPAVNEVIPVATRRWRRSLSAGATWGEVNALRCVLRTRACATIIDTQGLLRTGLIAKAANGTRHGYDRRSIREPLASLFYDRRHAVGLRQHAVARNRTLTAAALGYTVHGAPDYCLVRLPFDYRGRPYAVLLHATARASKQWPEANWVELGRALAQRGLDVVLPYGTDEEWARSMRLAAALPNARVPDRMPLDQVAGLIGGASLIVGVDTGLLHLAAAYGVPLIGIFTASAPALTGPVGGGKIAILGSNDCPPAFADVYNAMRAFHDI